MSGDYLKNPLGNLPLPDPSLFDPEKFGISPHLSDAGPETQDRDVRKDSDRLASTVGGGEKKEGDARSSTRGSGIFGSEPLQKKDDDGQAGPLLIGASVITMMGFRLFTDDRRGDGSQFNDRRVSVDFQNGGLKFDLRAKKNPQGVGIEQYESIHGSSRGFNGPKVSYTTLTSEHPHYEAIHQARPIGGKLAVLVYEGRGEYEGVTLTLTLTCMSTSGNHARAVDISFEEGPGYDGPFLSESFFIQNIEGNQFTYDRWGWETRFEWHEAQGLRITESARAPSPEIEADPLGRSNRSIFASENDLLEFRATFAPDGSLSEVTQVSIDFIESDGKVWTFRRGDQQFSASNDGELKLISPLACVRRSNADPANQLLVQYEEHAFLLQRDGDLLRFIPIAVGEYWRVPETLFSASARSITRTEVGSPAVEVSQQISKPDLIMGHVFPLEGSREVGRVQVYHFGFETPDGQIQIEVPFTNSDGDFYLNWPQAKARCLCQLDRGISSVATGFDCQVSVVTRGRELLRIIVEGGEWQYLPILETYPPTNGGNAEFDMVLESVPVVSLTDLGEVTILERLLSAEEARVAEEESRVTEEQAQRIERAARAEADRLERTQAEDKQKDEAERETRRAVAETRKAEQLRERAVRYRRIAEEAESREDILVKRRKRAKEQIYPDARYGFILLKDESGNSRYPYLMQISIDTSSGYTIFLEAPLRLMPGGENYQIGWSESQARGCAEFEDDGTLTTLRVTKGKRGIAIVGEEVIEYRLEISWSPQTREMDLRVRELLIEDPSRLDRRIRFQKPIPRYSETGISIDQARVTERFPSGRNFLSDPQDGYLAFLRSFLTGEPQELTLSLPSDESVFVRFRVQASSKKNGITTSFPLQPVVGPATVAIGDNVYDNASVEYDGIGFLLVLPDGETRFSLVQVGTTFLLNTNRDGGVFVPGLRELTTDALLSESGLLENLIGGYWRVYGRGPPELKTQQSIGHLPVNPEHAERTTQGLLLENGDILEFELEYDRQSRFPGWGFVSENLGSRRRRVAVVYRVRATGEVISGGVVVPRQTNRHIDFLKNVFTSICIALDRQSGFIASYRSEEVPSIGAVNPKQIVDRVLPFDPSDLPRTAEPAVPSALPTIAMAPAPEAPPVDPVVPPSFRSFPEGLIFLTDVFEMRQALMLNWLIGERQTVTLRCAEFDAEVDIQLSFVGKLSEEDIQLDLGKTVTIRVDGKVIGADIRKDFAGEYFTLPGGRAKFYLSVDPYSIGFHTGGEDTRMKFLFGRMNQRNRNHLVVENYMCASWMVRRNGIFFPVENFGDPIPEEPKPGDRIWRGYRCPNGEIIEVELIYLKTGRRGLTGSWGFHLSAATADSILSATGFNNNRTILLRFRQSETGQAQQASIRVSAESGPRFIFLENVFFGVNLVLDRSAGDIFPVPTHVTMRDLRPEILGSRPQVPEEYVDRAEDQRQEEVAQTRRVPFATADGQELELEIENFDEGRWQPDLVVEVTDGDQLRRRFVRVFDGETQIEALLQEHARFNGYAVFWITTHSPRHSFDVAIAINEATGDAVQLSEEDIDLTGQEFESRVLYRLDIEGPERRASDDVGTRSTSARSGDEGPTVFSTFPDDSSFSGERMGLIKREADTPINFDIPTEVGRHVIIGFNFGDYDAGRDVDAEMIVGVERMVDGRVKILWVEVTTFTVGEEATRFDFMDNGWLRVRQAGASSPFHYEIYVERDQLKVAVFIGGTPEGLRVAKTVAAISDEVKVPEATALPTPPKTGLEASAQVLDRSRPNSPHVSLSIQDHDQGVSININLWVDATSQNPQLIFDGRTQVQMTQTGTTTLRLIQVYEGNVIRIGDRFYQLELDLDPDASQPSLKIEPIDDPQSRPLGSLRHKRGFQENAARIFSRYFPSGTNYTQQFFIPSNEKEEYLSKREGQAPTDPGSISDAGARRERTEDERSSLLHHWNVIDFPHSRLEVVASSRQSGSWFSLLQRTSQAGGIHTGSVRIRITPTDGEGLPYLPGRRFQAQSRDIRVRRSSYEVVNIHGLAPIILMMDRRTGDVVPLSPSYWESLNDPHIFDETVAKMHHVYGVALRYGKSGRELKGSTQPAESGRVATSDLKVPPSKPQPPDAKPLPLPEVFGEDPSPDDPVEEWRFTEIEGGASLRKTQDGSWVHNFFDFFDKSGRRLDILVIEKGNKFYLHINVDGEGVTCRIHARSGNITLIQLDVASGPPLVLGFDRENERFLWVEPVVVTEEHAKPFIRPLERPLIPRLEDGQELTRDFPVGDQQAQVQLRVSFGMWQLPIVVNDGKPALRIILDGVEREILIEGNRQIDEGRIVVYELSGLGMALAVNRQSGEVVTVENTDLELGESGFISRVRYRFCEGGVGRSWPSSFLPWQLEDEGPTTDRPNLFILEPNPVPQEAPPAAQPPDAEAPEVEPSVTRELSPPLEPVAPPLTTPVELPAEAGAQAEVDPFADALAELDTIDRDVADEPDRFNTSQRAALDAAREAGLPEEVSAFVEVAFPSDGKELGVPAQRVHSLVFGQILPKVNPDVLDAAKEALGKAVALLSRLHSGGQKGFVAVPDSVADSIESIRQGFFSDLADYRAHQQLRRLPPGVSDLQTNGLPREAVRQEVIEVYRQAYPEAFARFSTTSEVDGESWTKFNEVLNYAIDAGVAIQPLLDGRNPYIGLSHEIAAQRFLASQAHLNQLLSEGFFKGETRQMLADLRASNQGFYAEHFDDVIALQAKIHTVPVGFGEHFQFHTTGRASYGHKGLILYEVLKALVVTAREPHFGTAGFLMAMADNFSHSMPQLAGFLAIDHTATQAFHLVGRGFSILRHADKVQIKMQESVFQQLIRGKPVTAMTAEGLKDWSLGLARSLFKPGLFTAVMTLEVIAIVNNKELRLLVDMQDEAVQEIASHEKTRRLMRAGVSGAMGFGSGVYVGTSVAAYVSGGAIGGTSASPLGTIAGTVIGLGVGFLVAEASGRAFDAVYAEFAGYDTKEDLIPELKRRLQQDYPIFSFEDSEIFTRLDQMQPKTWDEILHVYVEIKETLDAYHSLEYLVSQSGQDLISDYGIDQHPVSLARWDLVSGLDWLEAMDYLDVKKISLPFAALNFGTLFYLLAAALRRPPGHKELKLEPTGELDAYEMGRIVECELQTYLDGYGELDTELVQAVVVVDPNAMRFQAAVQKGKRTDYTVFDVMAELESNPAPHLRHYLYVGGPDGDETTFARQIIAALAGHDEKQDWIVKQAFDDQEGFFGFDGIKFGGTAFEVYDFVENGIRDFQIANPVKEELSDEYLAKIMWPKLHAWRPDLFVAEAPDYKEYPTLNILQSFSPGVEDQVSVQISYLAQQDLARREDAKKYLRGVITGDTIQNLLDIKLEDKEDKIKDETLDRNAKTALEMAQKGKFLAKTPIILRELLEAGRIIEASEIASAILENHPATKQAIDEKLLDPEVYTDFFDYDRQRVEAVWSAYGDLYKDEFESQFKKEVDPDLVEEWALRIFYERFIKNQFYHKTIDDVLEDDLIYARIPKEERTAYRHLTPEIAKLLWDQKTNAVRLPSEVVARVFSKNPGLKDEFGVLADPENLNFVNAYINGDYQTWSYDDPSESEDFTDEGRPVIEELLTRSAWDWSLEDFEALHEALVLGKQDLDYNHDEFYDLVCEVIEAHEDLRTLWGQEEVPDVLRHPELSELVSLYQVDWLLKNLEIMIFTERYEKSTVCNEDGYGQDADSDSDL